MSNSKSIARIGLAIARRLGQEGASVVVSSRGEGNVAGAVAGLKEEGISVAGAVCNVAKAEQREALVQTVSFPGSTSPASRRSLNAGPGCLWEDRHPGV